MQTERASTGLGVDYATHLLIFLGQDKCEPMAVSWTFSSGADYGDTNATASVFITRIG